MSDLAITKEPVEITTVRKRRVKLAAFWADLPLRRKAWLVVLLPMIGLFVGFVLLWFTNHKERNAQLWVDHSLQVRNDIRFVINGVLEAEVGVRGFVISRREELLEGYKRGQQTVPRSIARLEQLVSDDPMQVSRVKELHPLIEQRFKLMQALQTASEDSNTPIADERTLAVFSQGTAVMNALRAKINEMDKEEARLQAIRVAKAEQLRNMSLVIGGCTVLVGLLGGWSSVYLLGSGIVQRVVAIEKNADRLAREVPLLPMPSGNDEIGHLAHRLETVGALLAERRRALREEAERLAVEAKERKAAESALHHSEERYRLLFESNPYPIWVYDLETLSFLAVNEAAVHHYGYSQEEFLSMTIKDTLPEKDIPALLNHVSKISPEAETAGTWQNRKKDGSLIDVEITARPISFSGKRARLVLVNDITERARTEKALKQAKEEADRANHAKSDFLSRMSHELRTPMNAILGFAQLLEMEQLTADQQESVGHVIRGGRHLLELINEVLDISRIEAGRLSLSPEPVEVGEALRETIALVRPLAADRDVRLIPPPAPCDYYLLADRQRLKQVLINLISNSIKYNRAGGSVTISCEKNDSRARIFIRDTGIGIPAERLEQLFTPFERLGAEQSTIEGTGLGLAVAKRLVEAMDGAIGVDSVAGEGTTFWLDFPLTQSPLARAELPEAETERQHVDPGEKRSVLYIEDNLSNLRLIERVLLRRPTIELLSAPDGTEGLKLAQEHVPNLILLDLNLPDMHGHEVLNLLQSDPRCVGIPVVVISADATSVQEDRLRGAGAIEYLTKPLNIKKFLDVLDRCLNGARQNGRLTPHRFDGG